MIDLSCSCGAVRAHVTTAARRAVNRVVCYCDDCQAFAHYLKRQDLLDPQGGSDIVQLAPASLCFTNGQQNIAGLRLTPKGLYRWYAACCGTPLGNTVGAAVPFVGVVAQTFQTGGKTMDQMIGKPIGAIRGEYAVGEVPESSKGIAFTLLMRSIMKVLVWRLTGQSWPNPFFNRADGKPTYPFTTLDTEQRESLRPLCGPAPGALSRE